MNNNFCIVANNCWGAEVYKYKKLPFNTPFIGLYLYPDCYIKLVQNFRNYIKSDLHFSTSSKYLLNDPTYPVGILQDQIEIHFLHYKTIEEATEKWNKRLERIPSSDEELFFKFDDRDGCELKHLDAFHKLKFKNKISFSIANLPQFKSNIQIIGSQNQTCVHDGLALFKISIRYFNIEDWLEGQGVKVTIVNQLAKAYYILKRAFNRFRE